MAVPASLERSTYIWIASLLLIAVCALWTPVPDVAWDVDGPWRWPLHLIQISGGWLTICSAATLDVRELAGVADPVGERLPAVDGNSNRDTGPPPPRAIRPTWRWNSGATSSPRTWSACTTAPHSPRTRGHRPSIRPPPASASSATSRQTSLSVPMQNSPDLPDPRPAESDPA